MKDRYIKEIKEFLEEHHLEGADVKRISEDDMLFELRILDSFGIVELIAFLEDRYSIELDADDLVINNLMMIRAIAAMIDRKISEK